MATPVVAVQLGMMLMGTVDVMMLGRVDEGALAAGALGNAIGFGIMWMGIGILMSLDPLVAQAFGAGDHHEIGRQFSRAVVLAVLLSVPLSLLTWNVGNLLRYAGHAPELVTSVTTYLRGITPGLLGFFLYMVMRQTLQAMSLIRPALIAMAVANLFNVVANYALVFGHFGFPAMGVRGSAYATACSRWVMCLVLLWAAWPVFRRYWSGLPPRVLSPGTYVDFLRIGVPISIQVSLEMWVFSTVAVLMGALGSAAVAGHQVALNLAALTFMVPLGIAGAAATRVGNAIGRRDPEAARRTASLCLLLGGGVMSISAVIFFAVPELLSRAYTSEPEVIAIANLLIPIAALFQVADGIQVVAAGTLRGTADTRYPAIIAFIGFWILGLPIGAWLTYRLELGPAGLWWGLTSGLTVVAVLLLARVRLRLRR